jgi:hypothetical protein
LARRDTLHMQQVIPTHAQSSNAQQHGITQMPSPRCHAFALGILFATVLLVYSSAFRYPSINPDFVTEYTTNVQRTINGVLGAYVDFQSPWYRPSSSILMFWIAGKVLGWHNIFGFQWLGILMIFALAISVYALMLTISRGYFVALAAAVLASTHHGLFVNVYDAFISDAVYQILCFACLALLLTPTIPQRKPMQWVMALGVLYAVALTSKEQALALGGAVALLSLIQVGSLKGAGKRTHWVLLSVMTLETVLYVSVTIAGKLHAFSGEPDQYYRIWPSFTTISKNLLTAGMSTVRVFFSDYMTDSWYFMVVHDNWMETTLGLLGLAVVVPYVVATVRRPTTPDATVLTVVSLLIGCFSAIPVVAGGAPHHYAIPGIAYSMILAFGLGWLVRQRQFGGWLFGGFVMVYVLVSAVGFWQEALARRSVHRINTEALLHPPVPRAAMPHGALVVYANNGEPWAYGAGQLFIYVYDDLGLQETPVRSLNDIPTPTVQSLLIRDDAFVFAYDPLAFPAWSNVTDQVRAEVEHTLKGAPAPASLPWTISLTRGSEDTFVLGRGWSSQESWGTWTVGPEVDLYLHCACAEARNLVLEAEVHGFTSSKNPLVQVEIFAGTEMLGVWRFDTHNPGGKRHVTIPGVAWKSAPAGKIVFRILGAASPASSGLAGDPRLLGMHVSEFRIRGDNLPPIH